MNDLKGACGASRSACAFFDGEALPYRRIIENPGGLVWIKTALGL